MATFCDSYASILTQVISTVILICTTMYNLLSSGASWLIVLAVLSAPLSVIGHRFLLIPVAKSIFKKDASEGDFRHGHARIREYSESMMFYKADETERNNVANLFKKLYGALIRYSWWNAILKRKYD